MALYHRPFLSRRDSVNDMIDPALCSLSYITVNQVAQEAMRLGREALLAKIDIKSAHRLITVHPMDRQWLKKSSVC